MECRTQAFTMSSVAATFEGIIAYASRAPSAARLRRGRASPLSAPSANDYHSYEKVPARSALRWLKSSSAAHTAYPRTTLIAQSADRLMHPEYRGARQGACPPFRSLEECASRSALDCSSTPSYSFSSSCREMSQAGLTSNWFRELQNQGWFCSRLQGRIHAGPETKL